MLKIVVVFGISLATPVYAQPLEEWNPFQQLEQQFVPIEPETPQKLDPNILDQYVNLQQTSARTVLSPVKEDPGTIVINTKTRRLFLMQKGSTATEYKIAVGKIGFSWKGTTTIHMKVRWPAWTPPKTMLKRHPELPERTEGGLDNPLGARALYLFDGERDTLFRIHGNNNPSSIGKRASSGCFRMYNADVIDLYNRVPTGTTVIIH